MQVEVQKEHQWLQRLVGEWEYETECIMAPDQPAMAFTGKESVRTLGGVWTLCEGQGEVPGGGTCNVLMTLGYDPARKKFVGTFIGAMMTHMFLYEGELDAAGAVLTLDTEGPSCLAPDKLARYKDVIEIKDDNHRVLTSRYLGDDGQWHLFMTAQYQRVRQASALVA